MSKENPKPNKLVKGFKETVLLLRTIPSVVVALFVVSVITMNLLANKTLIQTEYLALDGGILVSWLSFMCMDIVTKHFGPKAATRLSIFAMIVNLLVCLIFYIVSIIPSQADDYSKFNEIFGGTWFILLSSSIAFLCSAIINNVMNWVIGKAFKKNPDGKLAFITRSYVSTFIGQFFDNLIFAMLTFMLFAPIFWDGFHWTFIQCVTCSLIGAGFELILEVVFSPFGYWVIPIPGKNALGIQVPNKTATPVYMRSLLESKEWNESKAAVPVLLGQDMEGKTAILDFAKAPHLLIAGDAKSEVSACLNTIILSLLFKFSPNELTFLILAPKSGPLSVFGRIPHMLVPIVSEPKEYVPTLRWAADEVDRRYKVLAKVKAKNLTAFNSRLADSQLLTDDDGNVIPQKLPVLVIIISELADVMMADSTDREEAEMCICRIAQNGHAAGIHLIIMTQSPRKEIVTGLIKANIPTKIAFRVNDINESRVFLDTKGAEKLLGNGDMLFNPPDGSPLKRIQSPFVSEDEVSKVVAEVRKQSEEQR